MSACAAMTGPIPLKAPFPWFGGKSRAASLVWERLGDVGNFVEPFAGSLAVLLQRSHEPRIETVNDRDCYLANFWRAVHGDPDQVAYWADWPVSECDLQARHRWLCGRRRFRRRMLYSPDYYDAKIAGWWVWGISQWIGAGWCSRPEWIGRGQGGRCPRGLNANIQLSSEMGVHSSAAWAGNLDGKNKRPVLNRGSRGVTNVHAQRFSPRFEPDWQNRPELASAGKGIHSPRRRRVPEDPDWQHRPHLSDGGNGVRAKRPHLGSNGPGMGVHNNNAIYEWMYALANRLRRVRVCCGDWSRIVTPSCTWKLGGGQLTGVFLDPPYSHEMRDNRLYSVEQDVAADVRKWAIENGPNSMLRIALCGLEGEHEMPAGWTAAYWRAPRGYSNKGPRKEVIWFSPYCLKPQAKLFDEAQDA